MNGILQRSFASMTEGADMRGVLIKSSVMALLSTIFIIPYFHYLISVMGEGGGFFLPKVQWDFLFAQLFLVFILCFLSAMIGFSFSLRFELPRKISLDEVIRRIPLLLLLGGAMITISYLLFDRYFYEVSPISYPKDLICLLAFPLKGAFADEVILRLCLVTICVGLLKSKGAAVVLVSALSSLFTIKYFHFVGIEFGFNYLCITQLVLSFAANLVLGYFFVTKGLVYSMILKFLFGMKYMVLVLVMGV